MREIGESGLVNGGLLRASCHWWSAWATTMPATRFAPFLANVFTRSKLHRGSSHTTHLCLFHRHGSGLAQPPFQAFSRLSWHAHVPFRPTRKRPYASQRSMPLFRCLATSDALRGLRTTYQASSITVPPIPRYTCGFIPRPLLGRALNMVYLGGDIELLSEQHRNTPVASQGRRCHYFPLKDRAEGWRAQSLLQLSSLNQASPIRNIH